MDLKKRVLRTVINEIVVDVNHDSGHVEMNIHWAGGVHTPLRARKNQVGKNGNANDANVIDEQSAEYREILALQDPWGAKWTSDVMRPDKAGVDIPEEICSLRAQRQYRLQMTLGESGEAEDDQTEKETESK